MNLGRGRFSKPLLHFSKGKMLRFFAWLVFFFKCLGGLLFLQFLKMTQDPSTGQYFGSADSTCAAALALEVLVYHGFSCPCPNSSPVYGLFCRDKQLCQAIAPYGGLISLCLHQKFCHFIRNKRGEFWSLLEAQVCCDNVVCFKTNWLFQGNGEETKSCIVTLCLLSCQVSVSKTWTVFLVD